MNANKIKPWLAVALLALGLFLSCSKDSGTEPSTPETPSGEVVTLSLRAEISLEDNDFRGIDFKLEQVGTKAIPRPQFADGQEVDVHTVVKSDASGAVAYAKTLKWKYVADGHKLALKTSADPANSITIPNFSDTGGVKWYIAGLLAPGTILDETNKTVDISGTRELKAMTSTDVANLNVPYYFAWTELKLDGEEAHALTSPTFKPLGSLIKYQLGNALTGSYSFSPTGFTVVSNAYNDQGTFDLNTDVTAATPTWTAAVNAAMVYTFATGHAPSAIAHNANADKVYYTWVMSSATPPATVQTRVMLKGTSGQYALNPGLDFTKTYYTDYVPKTSGSMGRVTQGKIHELKARAIRRVIVPIEYVTDYNLAGGGLIKNLTIFDTPNQELEGIKGGLRFSNVLPDGSPNPNPHQNDQSGYYTAYELMGIASAYNPAPAKNLQSDVNAQWPGVYFVPEQDHWWGIFPSNSYRRWPYQRPSLNQPDYIQLGYNQQQYLHGLSDYSATVPVAGNADNDVFHAIRFKAATSSSPVVQSSWFYDLNTSSAISRTYQPLTDNSLRCAYRFTRVGATYAWEQLGTAEMATHFRIDVVYLGEDPSVSGVNDIDENGDDWWSDRQAEGRVLTRIFPANGYVTAITSSSAYIEHNNPVGTSMHGWSTSMLDGNNLWRVLVQSLAAYSSLTLTFSNPKTVGFAVRLFKRDPGQ